MSVQIPRTLNFAGEEMLNKIFQWIKIKCAPNEILCSNKENEYQELMFILSLSGDMGIYMLRYFYVNFEKCPKNSIYM